LPDRPPEAQLPDEIRLTLREAGQVLFALDVAAERTEPGTDEHRQALAARRLMTAKLWPELGRLLDEDHGEAE
jgi:hypothetical protein